MQAIKVIPKMEKGPDGREREILFLPDSPANIGCIACCSPYEGHGEASIEYYLQCKPMGPEKCREAWANWYANYGGHHSPVKLAKRITAADRAAAYAHTTNKPTEELQS